MVFFYCAGFESAPLGSLAFLRLTNLLVCVGATAWRLLFFSCSAEARDFLARVLRDSCYPVVTMRSSIERREVNTAFPPREPLGGARPQSTSRVTEGRLVPQRAGTLSGPLAKLCRARLVAGVCAWKQFHFDEHHVHLCNAVRLRKRRELGEARFESDELENAVGRKRLLEQHCSREVAGAENFP